MDYLKKEYLVFGEILNKDIRFWYIMGMRALEALGF